MSEAESLNIAELRQAAEEGRRQQLKTLGDFEAGKTVVVQGVRLSKKELPPMRERGRPPLVRFHGAEELMDCVAEDDVAGVERLLTRGTNTNLADGDGMTPLHRACVEGNLKVVSLLIEHGADVNAYDHDWWTPLHTAASSGGWRICNKLLEAGADPTAVNANGDLPYDLCSDSRVEGVLQREMDSRGLAGKLDELRSMPEQQMLQNMQTLARTGGTFHKLDSQGAAPLHVAACNGYSSVARFLLSQPKIDINIRDASGNTPLHLAVYFSVYEVVLQLTLAGADTTAKNMFDQIPVVLTEDSTMLRLLSAVSSHAVHVDVGAGVRQSTLRETVHRKHRLGSIRKDAADEGRAFGK